MAFYGEQDFPRGFTLLIIQDFIAFTNYFFKAAMSQVPWVFISMLFIKIFFYEKMSRNVMKPCQKQNPLISYTSHPHPHIVILGIYLNLIQSFQKETSKGWIQLTLFTIYSLNKISLILAVNSKSCSKKFFCHFDQLLSN